MSASATGRADRVRIKRVYEPAQRTDGARVLVDRLWPRGLTRQRASLAAWMPEVAPSPALRKWFDHRPDRFAAFSTRYRRELADEPERLEPLRKLARRRKVTLLYAARDERVNHAAILAGVLKRSLSRQ